MTDDAGRELKSDSHYVVISSDSHAGADLYDYKPYLAARWHEEFDAWAAAYTNPWDFVDPRMEKEGFDFGQNEILTGPASWHSALSWDSPRRLLHMDQDGVCGEVIYPNTAPPFMPGSVLVGGGIDSRADYERRWAGLQAHNRWLADFVAEAPERRAGVGEILFYDLDDALAEVRAIKEMGLRGGVLLPMDSPTSNATPLYSTELEPLWALCNELDMPIHKHASAPPALPGEDKAGPGVIAISLLEGRFWTRRCLSHMILSGVFERYPEMKFVLTETGSGWIVDYLATLDSYWHIGRDETHVQRFLAPAVKPLSLTPTEYFKRNVFLGASLLLPTEANQRDDIGVENIMFGVDYPHSEGTFPFTKEAIALLFADASPQEAWTMLGGTAATVFDFDIARLQPLADRIGPTVAEIMRGPGKLPAVPAQTISPTFASAR